MGEGRGMGREWGGKEEGRKMGIHEENSFKAQQIWLFGRPLGATARCHTL